MNELYLVLPVMAFALLMLAILGALHEAPPKKGNRDV